MFYMCKFDGPSLKRHLALSNCEEFLASLTARGGYVSMQERDTLVKIKLAAQGKNRSGRVNNKFAGIKKLLKASQPLGSANLQAARDTGRCWPIHAVFYQPPCKTS